jgi:SAM-dependent methyltransferase
MMRKPLHRLVPPEAIQWVNEYRRSVLQQMLLQELVRAAGTTDGMACADVGIENPMVSALLRRLGGTWHTVALSDGVETAATITLKSPALRLIDGRLPFQNKTLDLVILVGVLERVGDDAAFIEECHRVLKPTGRLIVETANRKSGSVVNSMERMLAMDYESVGLPRPGYDESELFQILKHGFDVSTVRSYVRFFTRLNQLLGVAALNRAGRLGKGAAAFRRIRLLGRVASWFAYQFDYLIWFTRGFRLVAVTKRRAWLPRKTPVLADGRSITEAVLTRAPR